MGIQVQPPSSFTFQFDVSHQIIDMDCPVVDYLLDAPYQISDHLNLNFRFYETVISDAWFFSPKHEFQELSNDDYFSKNNEFATWLKEERGVFFSDLSSEAARELFLGFIKDWNNQKLESRYYEGITTGPRTAHNWKITREKRS
ncbi:hypothetical protein BVC80_531g18 [Macleaya cordata]|uniref:Uncharacterized protein n=1 Tax=Macleaya cordata TaxID=56857 RepID=A0A200PMU8_MACCD|nr:hypothetical protein BVC80_531g18 [Macleaya cordata]